jgi:hypothetical protein
VRHSSSHRAGGSGLGIDPEAVLIRESGLLLGTQFMGALHAELQSELGPAAAALILMQIGFLHGLRDSTQVLAESFEPRAGSAVSSVAPLALDLRSNPQAQPSGAIEMFGSWPERHEAAARVRALDPDHGRDCAISSGYTSGWLSGMLDANMLALETTCSARGGDACRFLAREADVWRVSQHSRALSALAALPFDELRAAVSLHAEGVPLADDPHPEGVDPDQAVIHIWGPVMVIPYTSPDEAMRAVELIGRDPGAAAVSVIVIDLTGAVIDEAFGAAALERIVESIETWGAEAVFAGVSPLSARAVNDLDRQPLLVEKDLNEAIAAAFQIAESQRRLV